MDIKQQTQNVANQGRYGDSMLLHVNPAEVKGLAQAMPITVNPQTGQPEAFLPFLAPVLGSMAGSALLTGAGAGGILGAAGLSSALASGIGAGLATYAQTGGSGSKALMSALTGYGGAKAAELAGSLAAKDAAIAQATTGAEKIGFDAVQSANMLPDMQTQLFQNVSPGVNAPVVLGPQVAGFDPSKITQQTLDNMIKTTGGYTDAGQLLADQTVSGLQEGIARAGTRASEEFVKSKPTMFQSLGKAFDQGMPEGFGNLAQGATSLGAYAPMAVGMGGTSIMNSQDLYEEQMRQMEIDEEQRRRDMYANNPEVQLYSAAGGTTNFGPGGMIKNLVKKEFGLFGMSKNKGSFLKQLHNHFKERINAGDEQGANEVALQIQEEEANQMAYGGMTQFSDGGDTDYGYESKKQVYAPAKQQYAVNPDFMAGFAPETMYFRPDTLNAPSVSTRGGSAPTLGADTYTGTKGGYDYEGSYDADGNFVAGTAQGVQFAPQTAIDPYAAYTGSAPQGLVQSAYNPYPVQTMSMSPTDETQDTSDYTDIGGGDYSGNPDYDYSNATDSAGNPLTGSPYDPYDQQAVQDIRDQYSNYFFDYDDIQDFYRDEMADIGRQAGGDTDKKMPNKGLEALNKVAPDVVDKMGYQEGGQTDPLIQEVTMFILGESDDQQVVNQFVDKYGVEAFTKLREEILQSLVPNAQTSGLIEGVGNGGMDDDIMGTIGNKEKIAVSQDEFIVPADVVSMLGDGSSDAGSKELYDMMDRVRMKKTGTTKQAPKLANAGGLLPA